MSRYNHKKVEKKWQKAWEKEKAFLAEDFSKKKKFYFLVEFPYPSGEGLHVGHPRSYVALDIMAHKKRMEGFNVLYPFGFDSFGLPAENYAIKTGTDPKITIQKNIKTFTRQLKSLGLSFDWSRAFSTTDPTYYRWTQWIFLQFFKRGLAYKAKIPINWCPKDKIGLANEEVVNGKCERCGTAVERREKEQWLLKITKYADRLIDDLENVDYLEKIKIQQKNWIGRSQGATIKFEIRSTKSETNSKFEIRNSDFPPVEVFTTRPDTIFGATFVVVAPEHPIIGNFQFPISNFQEVKEYVEKAKRKSDMERTELAKEKTGVELKGIKAINPATGKEIPVFVADYVLLSYGTGAIMGVPAHDERDFEFAKKYNLPITEVIRPLTPTLSPEGRGSKGEGGVYVELSGKLVNSGKFSGLSIQDGIQKITEWLVKANIGKKIIHYKLRDWVFSRQRYWGEPIPLVYCEQCKNKKQKVLIIHGFESNAQGNWKPWMKQELEKAGFEVFVPTMSTSAHPTLESWIRELMPYIKKMGENDIIVGHSLGSKAALHLLEKAKKNIGTLYLVGSAIGEVEDRDWQKLREEWKGSDVDALKKFWEVPVDFNEISKYALSVNVILSDDDPYIRKKTHENLPMHWNFELWSGFGHFTKIQEPALRDAILKSKHTGWVALPQKDLPLTLPNVKKYEPTDSGESPLSKIGSWVKTKCPVCNGAARRETDVMPNWAGSNWYYLAYAMRGISNFQFPISKYKEILKYWMPVDWYNGGMEHTTLHLLYSRFVYKFLWDIGAVPKECGSEPYKKRTSHGLILGESGEKMSKSRGNVVNPDDIVGEFGADVMRLYEMFIGQFNQAVPWDTKGILGMKRFLDRVWAYAVMKSKVKNQKLKINDREILQLLHQTIRKVTEDIEGMHFNTAISALMILFNKMSAYEFRKEIFEDFLKLLSPFAPHITEELWQMFGNKKSILHEAWPRYEEKYLESSEFNIVIQVNGKVRDIISIEGDFSEEEIMALALASPKVQRHAAKERIVKKIYVPKKLLNIVVKL